MHAFISMTGSNVKSPSWRQNVAPPPKDWSLKALMARRLIVEMTDDGRNSYTVQSVDDRMARTQGGFIRSHHVEP